MHERKSFFKYTTAEVAQIIMRRRSLRWSSPNILNDPFDVVRELAEGIKPSDIQECMIEAMIELIDSKEQIPDGLNPWLGYLFGAIRQSNDSIRQQVIDICNDERTKLIQYSERLEELRAEWRDVMPSLRILCFSKENDIAPMWDHYADKYRGVVFEFVCSPELDSKWLDVKNVNYPEGSPMLSEAKE